MHEISKKKEERYSEERIKKGGAFETGQLNTQTKSQQKQPTTQWQCLSLTSREEKRAREGDGEGQETGERHRVDQSGYSIDRNTHQWNNSLKVPCSTPKKRITE